MSDPNFDEPIDLPGAFEDNLKRILEVYPEGVEGEVEPGLDEWHPGRAVARLTSRPTSFSPMGWRVDAPVCVAPDCSRRLRPAA
jgi:hypothetical protein